MNRLIAAAAAATLFFQPPVEPYMVGMKDDRDISLFLDSSYSGDVIVPKEYNGRIVTEVYIDRNRNITSVILPDTVKTFYASNCSAAAYYVAEDNPYLCSVDGVIYSKDMDRLVRYPQGRSDRRFDVPDTVKIIDQYAFSCAEELVAVNLPEGLKKIETSAFSGTEISVFCLPESLESIGDEAFAGNTCLETITIPKNVSNIGIAFIQCEYLESIVLESTKAIEKSNECGANSDWSYDPLSFIYTGGDEPVVYLPDENYDGFMEEYTQVFGMNSAIKRVSEYTAPVHIMGDVNGDKKTSIADLVLLQRWLSGSGKIKSKDWNTADLCKDDRLDVFDLVELRRLLITKVTGLGKKAPVSTLAPSMPSIGSSRIPVFAVDFPDHSLYLIDFADMIKSQCFGEGNKNDRAYPLESIPAYFDRASYGKLNLECDVINYTAKKPAESYVNNNAQELVEEIMAEFEDRLDYKVYDINGDTTLDSMIIVVPESVISIDIYGNKIPDWWPFSANYSGSNRYDGIRVGTYCVSPFWPQERSGTNAKIAHELCHAMGLTDYYCKDSDNDTGDGGMTGDAGMELMDEGKGDLSAFSKLMLGWITEDEIQVYTGGEQTFTLNSSQQEPSCVIIPRMKGNDWFSEYFIIEFITGEANNSVYDWNGNRSSLFSKEGGVRILHCNAEISEDAFGMEFKYSINSPHYDSSDEKQRVLRLVNQDGLFYPGTRGLNYKNIIDSSVDDFAWYDGNGDMTVDTGLKVQISDFQYGPDYAPDPFSEGYKFYDPAYLNGGTYTITISPSIE
ncbi:leucine-rich repeat protein [Ruminococcus sp.]|uniref:leucine-rich repeat protein n=1 Tax=Ruminococcus sp. TaxID=41978 RepID=UPI001B533E50|nr:leucine-rich repeat protein [Ruminococcus sp.]MBP5433540.1 leucine-rich repeat protein [Ruminococcus sp.]